MREFLASKISKDQEVEIYPWKKWLRTPLIQKEKIEELFVFLNNIELEKLNTGSQDIQSIYYFHRIDNGEKHKEILFPVSKIKPVYFQLCSSDCKNVDISFGNTNKDKISYSEDFHELFNFNKVNSNEIKIHQVETELRKYDISNFMLKIINVKLWKNYEVTSNLISHDYFFESSASKVIEVDLLDKSPSISKPNSSVLSEIATKRVNYSSFPESDNFSYNNIQINTSITKLRFNDIKSDIAVRNILNEPYNDIFEKNILKTLEPKFELTAEERDSILSQLNEKERDVINKLIDNKFVSLNLPKFYNFQKLILYALKLLFRKREVTKAAIIMDEMYFQNKVFNKYFVENNWINQIKIITPEFNYSKEAVKDLELTGRENILFYDLISFQKLSSNVIGLFDAIITVDINSNLFDTIGDKYNWAIIDKKPDLSQSKSEINLEIPLENKIENELDSLYDKSKEEISDLLALGNIFRVNPQISKLHMTIERTVNKKSLYKRKILLDLLQLINLSNNNVIIYSQYENDGIKLIEKELTDNKIDHIVLLNNEPANKINSKIKLFASGKVKLLLTNIKNSVNKNERIVVDYKINYDNFWNPIVAHDTDIKSRFEINFVDTYKFTIRMKWLYKQLNLDNIEFLKLFDVKNSGMIFNENFWTNFLVFENSQIEFRSLNEFSEFVKKVIKYFNFNIHNYGADKEKGCYHYEVSANGKQVMIKLFYNNEEVLKDNFFNSIEMLKLKYDSVIIFTNLALPSKIKSAEDVIFFDQYNIPILSKSVN